MNILKPLIPQRADPWIYKHRDGLYYFTASVPEYDRIELRRSTSLTGLADEPGVVVWRKKKTGMMSANIWAPELHFIRGKWYIYFAAARTTETDNGLFDHRIYVLENESIDPLAGEWKEKGQLKTMWETFCLDATVFTYNQLTYMVWAQKDDAIPGNSNLYISLMSNPWTLDGGAVLLATPRMGWETIGFSVNEGPAFIHHGARIFISFSASATDHNYCMGLLYADADAGSDLLDPSQWTKMPYPVLHTEEARGLYGPGHNSFTQDEEGCDILVFHGRNYKDIEGDPLYDPNRHTFLCKIDWDEQDFPHFIFE
jgi:GH43 family beta-xylosidase